MAALGGMLTAMVLVKAYITYSQYMITWYASLPAEMSFYDAAFSWSGLLSAALALQLLVPFLVLLFPALRRRPSALGAVCICILLGSLLEACWMFCPGLGLEPAAWGTWLPLVLAPGVDGPDLLFFLPGGLERPQGISRITMNVPAAVSSLFRRRPDEWLPLFWLAAACVLGLVWSLVHASGLVAGVPLPWPAGRLMFSFYGALVYGWALPVLFSFMAENGCRRLKPAEWLWHLCVVLGMATIMAGDGKRPAPDAL